MVLETDHIVEIGIKTAMGEEETTTEVVIEIIGPVIGITIGPEIGTVTEMVIGITINQITEGKTVEIEIGGIEAAPEKAPNPEAVLKIDMKAEGRVEMIPEIEIGLNLDLDPLLM